MKKIPAFPVTRYTSNIAGVQELSTDDGMTLLQWYAGQALSAHDTESLGYDVESIAQHCYNIALAMVKEGELRE